MIQQRAFEPDDLACMTAAYDSAIGLMPQAGRHRALGSLLATHIIELVQTGRNDPDEICRLAVAHVRPRMERLGL